jgi:hypothetical protein
MSESEFFRSDAFNALVSKGVLTRIGEGDHWAHVFQEREYAQGLADCVSEFVRRTLPGARRRASCEQREGGYVAFLSIERPGAFGPVEGPLMCEAEQPPGLGLCHEGRWVVLPLKRSNVECGTVTGEFYLCFVDGTAFCRSSSEGPLPPAPALYFSDSETDARRVLEEGGLLKVTTSPKCGLFPLYLTGTAEAGANAGELAFAPGAFRLGSRINCVGSGPTS